MLAKPQRLFNEIILLYVIIFFGGGGAFIHFFFLNPVIVFKEKV